MQEIIWFFGSSASGKQTLIDSILENKVEHIKRLALEGNEIKNCKKASAWTLNQGQRSALVRIICDNFKEQKSLTLLVKGQNVDFQNRLIQNIKNEILGLKQTIIFVYTEPQEELQRWKKSRQWYKPDMSEQNVIAEVKLQIDNLIISDFKDIAKFCVNGGAGKNYEITDFPPK